MCFLEKGLVFPQDEEEFVKSLLKSKQVPLPANCRRGESKIISRNRIAFARELFHFRKQIFSSVLFEAKQTAKGFGLFARAALTVRRGGLFESDELFGILASVPQELFDQLKDKQFPSLFKDNREQGIVIGLLSLVNHSCCSPLSFFRGSRMFAVGTRTVEINQGEEITIRYANRSDLWFECQCGECHRSFDVIFEEEMEYINGTIESMQTDNSVWHPASSEEEGEDNNSIKKRRSGRPRQQ
jgi:hypothetical protein